MPSPAQAMVELALVMPIMLLLACATIDFGRGFYGAIQVQQAAETAARYGNTSSNSVTNITNQVYYATGTSTCSGCPTATNLLNIATPTVTVTFKDNQGNNVSASGSGSCASASSASNCSGGQIKVVVAVTVPLYTPFLQSLGFTGVTVNGSAAGPIA